MRLLDTLGRPLGNLRLSVTDRCNLRCHYCMPEDEYLWLPREDLLTFEEIARIVDLMGEVGVDRLRLTGGEPLLRRNLPELVALLAARPWLRDLAMTTNGVLLADAAVDLKRAGMHRVTVSLDTLQPERFAKLTRRDALPQVLAGIDAARRAGFSALKIDAVITRGDNDDELIDLIEYARSVDAEIRFIEYMDVGGATSWRPEAVVSRAEMLERLRDRYGAIESLHDPSSSAPADRFRLPDGLTFGIISSTTQPFCRTCDRARLTADGVLLLCLYAQHGTDLRRPLRAGASHETMTNLIRAVWQGRADRGAEERLGVRERGAYIPLSVLKRDAHLEMHTRGG
ncbi:MAG TPA: GTP 3',8-cyclase MoaA [Vicinamibacterales bacterium]|nr:GTP 3',8-cyclase MoaA [Vicinamibacterales bacterium]